MFLPAPGSEGRATWAAGAHDPRPSRPPTPPRVAGRQSPTARALGPSWPGQASELALMLWTPQPPPTLLSPWSLSVDSHQALALETPVSPASLGHREGAAWLRSEAKAAWCACVRPPPTPRCHCWPGHRPVWPRRQLGEAAGRGFPRQADNPGPAGIHARGACGPRTGHKQPLWSPSPGAPQGSSCSRACLLGCGLPRSWFCIWGLRGPIISCPGDSGRGSRGVRPEPPPSQTLSTGLAAHTASPEPAGSEPWASVGLGHPPGDRGSWGRRWASARLGRPPGDRGSWGWCWAPARQASACLRRFQGQGRADGCRKG